MSQSAPRLRSRKLTTSSRRSVSRASSASSPTSSSCSARRPRWRKCSRRSPSGTRPTSTYWPARSPTRCCTGWRASVTRTAAGWSSSPSPTATRPAANADLDRSQAAGFPGARVPGARLRGTAGRTHARAGDGVRLAVHASEGDRAAGQPLAAGDGRRADGDRRPGRAQPAAAAQDRQRSPRPVLRPHARRASHPAREQWLEEAQAQLDEQIDQAKLERLRTESEAKLATLRTELEAVNEALRAEARDDFDLPRPVVPEPS
jgi:hypothetical protein